MESNGLADRVESVLGDLRNLSGIIEPGTYSFSVSNPPYYPVDSGKVSPNPVEAGARHELSCTMEDVLSAARYALPVGGRLCLIYPAQRLVDLVQLLPRFKFRPARLLFVHPKTDRAASNFLLEATKAEKRELKVLPPLITHRPDGSYGEWYQELVRACAEE